MIFKRTLILILAPLILFSGCRTGRLTKYNLIPYSRVKDQVQLMVKPYNAEESKQDFGRNSLKKGFMPLKIVIENNSDNYYILHPWYIGLPITSPKKVAKALHRNNLLITMGMIAVGIFGVEWFTPLSFLLSGAIPTSVLIEYTNKQITKNVLTDSISRGVESVVIPPHGHIKRTCFIHEVDFEPQFMFTLFNSGDNKPVKFEVSLERPVLVSLPQKI